MENLVFTQLSIPEVRQLFRQELEAYFAEKTALPSSQSEPDELLTIQDAAAFLHLSVPTLYGKVHDGTIPHSKPGKRLYFSRTELAEWVKGGRRKTSAELGAEADKHISTKRR